MKRSCRNLTKKRNLNKLIEALSKMLEIYSVGVILNIALMMLYKLNILVDDKVYDICTIVIWLGTVVTFLCMLKRLIRVFKLEMSTLNGARILERDIRNNRENLMKSGCVVALFMVLHLNIILMTIAVCMVCCNLITLEISKKQQIKFNLVRGSRNRLLLKFVR